MADQEPVEKLGAAYVALKGLRAAGKLDDDTFHKMAVALAYEFAVLVDLDAAVAILQGIPASYYKTVQAQQMREDPDYARVARALAQKLVDEGVVDLGPVVRPTQAPGEA